MIPNPLLDLEILWLYHEKAKRESLLRHTMTTKEDRDNLLEFVQMCTNKKRADRRAELGLHLIKQFINKSRLPIGCSTLFKPSTTQ
jgi:hypothetical protein